MAVFCFWRITLTFNRFCVILLLKYGCNNTIIIFHIASGGILLVGLLPMGSTGRVLLTKVL